MFSICPALISTVRPQLWLHSTHTVAWSLAVVSIGRLEMDGSTCTALMLEVSWSILFPRPHPHGLRVRLFAGSAGAETKAQSYTKRHPKASQPETRRLSSKSPPPSAGGAPPLPSPPLQGEGMLTPSPLEGEGWGEGERQTQPLPETRRCLRFASPLRQHARSIPCSVDYTTALPYPKRKEPLRCRKQENG